jgi:hypothetical protein
VLKIHLFAGEILPALDLGPNKDMRVIRLTANGHRPARLDA